LDDSYIHIMSLFHNELKLVWFENIKN
jgi:hypothetical protein